MSKDELQFFLDIQSVPMLWSYVRETINNCMLKMGLNPVLLPVLNITQIIKDIEESKQKREGEEGDE